MFFITQINKNVLKGIGLVKIQLLVFELQFISGRKNLTVFISNCFHFGVLWILSNVLVKVKNGRL